MSMRRGCSDRRRRHGTIGCIVTSLRSGQSLGSAVIRLGARTAILARAPQGGRLTLTEDTHRLHRSLGKSPLTGIPLHGAGPPCMSSPAPSRLDGSVVLSPHGSYRKDESRAEKDLMRLHRHRAFIGGEKDAMRGADTWPVSNSQSTAEG
ncbi:hypothetical protein N7492_005584 [Penicillium capsulatum]|uniref:Uncharacterized protein n=1 Tax=Penicillium capsulatum TaxID=69766 RepID=A0A9W9LRT2_9EURO|nr:hypothetical protein N7492_005584 [Penicillium capsulatum]KAJ6135317.1 hypothetical protein N7512_000477 [Penicillium capsulatum]